MSVVVLNEAAVLERYAERLEAEQTEVIARQDELLAGAEGLKNVRDSIASVGARAVQALKLSTHSPLISHVLLRQAYADLPRPPRITDGMRAFTGQTLLGFIDAPGSDGLITGGLDPQALPGLCSHMEFAFYSACEQAMDREVSERGKQTVISVYHDEEGRPLVFQKSLDEANGLTLEPADLSGLAVPAGTAVGVGFAMKRAEYITGSRERPDGTKLFTYMVPDGLHLMPRRPTPWIHADPADRALFAVGNDAAGAAVIEDPGRIDYTSSHSLEDFREAAANVMSWCGV